MGGLIQFHYEVRGLQRAPYLVFLHGLMGNLKNWRTISKSFEPHFSVLLLDQRGHGKSFQPLEGYRPEDYADDLLKILDELNWDKIHLVGHSLGGRNAMNFTYRFPDRVSKLVIEDIGPDGREKATQWVEELFSKIPVPFHSKEKAKEFIHTLWPGVLGSFLLSNIVEIRPGVFGWCFSKNGIVESVRLGRTEDRWYEAQALRVPTLVLRGSQSTDLSRDVFERLIQCSPYIAGEEIAGAGHWIHFDQPDAFIKALKNFFYQPFLNGL